MGRRLFLYRVKVPSSHCRGGSQPPAQYQPAIKNQSRRIRIQAHQPTVGAARSRPRSTSPQLQIRLGEFVPCPTWYHSTKRPSPVPYGRLRASPTVAWWFSYPVRFNQTPKPGTLREAESLPYSGMAVFVPGIIQTAVYL